MSRLRILTDSQAAEIKTLLWHGVSQPEISLRFRISQSSVSGIMKGVQYGEIAWPDGSFGSIPLTRRRQIHFERQAKVGFIKTASPAIEEAARRALEYNSSGDDSQLEKAIKDVPIEKLPLSHQEGEKAARLALKFEAISDEQLVMLMGSSPLFQEVKDEPLSRLAMRIVLHALPPERWLSDRTKSLVLSVRKDLERHRGDE